MRFIGNKELITTDIKKLLDEQKLTNKDLTLFDAFCGTGAVSDALKDSFNIISNDMLKWSVVYTKGRVCAKDCDFINLGFDPFLHFNADAEIIEGFFYQNYSPGASNRMYFTAENAGRIDYFRITIEDWKNTNRITENEYAYLLASLIESVSTVSNTAGVYGAFLKHWDPRAVKPIEFKKVSSYDANHNQIEFLNSKLEDIIEDVQCDILYLDPPYTQNQYGTQYHLLETLVLYDAPGISKVTGSRSTTPMRSDWSKDYKSHILFDRIIAKTKARYIIFSYSIDGLMSRTFIEASLKRYGKPDTYFCKKLSYKKYTNSKSKEKNTHFEYLFFVEKKDSANIFYESPLNYIGSKAKMASYIKQNLPEKIACFVDAFGGGFNVGINVDADEIIYNDLNHFVSNLVASFKLTDTYTYIMYLKRVIKKFGLEPENAETFLKVREHYNSLPLAKRDPKLLYTVILYGFNQQIRFNSNHDFNNPVGMRWFNDKVLEKLISFSRVIKEKNITFEKKAYDELPYEENLKTFSYLDPPYMLTTGSYNDGKRGFVGWTNETEVKFFDFIKELNRKNQQFMVSYVLEHNGKFNNNLATWIEKENFNVIYVDPSLGNQRKEILITNYSENEQRPFYNKEQIPEEV